MADCAASVRGDRCPAARSRWCTHIPKLPPGAIPREPDLVPGHCTPEEHGRVVAVAVRPPVYRPSLSGAYLPGSGTTSAETVSESRSVGGPRPSIDDRLVALGRVDRCPNTDLPNGPVAGFRRPTLQEAERLTSGRVPRYPRHSFGASPRPQVVLLRLSEGREPHRCVPVRTSYGTGCRGASTEIRCGNTIPQQFGNVVEADERHRVVPALEHRLADECANGGAVSVCQRHEFPGALT